MSKTVRKLGQNHSSKSAQNTRVKVNRKKTVGITLPPNLVKKARKHKLNISRITEQALNSILDYLETQNQAGSSDFLSSGSFLKESEWTGRDLNPRPPRCQRGDHSKLIYPPSFSQRTVSRGCFDILFCPI